MAGRSAARDEGRALPRGTLDDAALMERIANRDLRAFEQVYRAYHPRLTRFLLNMTRRPSLVDEVLNDTLMVVWDRPGGFNGTSRLSSWIFAIAYRKALKALRQQDVPVEDRPGDEQASSEPAPDQAMRDREMQQTLHEALHELSADHRTVVELTYFQDFGYREIAEIMSCPVDTVKTRMFYARRHLGRLFAGSLADWL